MESIKFNQDSITAILEGRKTMTRRPIKDCGNTFKILNTFDSSRKYSLGVLINEYSKYKIGETVLLLEKIEQTDDICPHCRELNLNDDDGFNMGEDDFGIVKCNNCGEASYYEKVFRDCAYTNPYCDEEWVSTNWFIKRGEAKITNIKVERLQDITLKDCVKEGTPHQSKEEIENSLCSKSLWHSFKDEVWNKLPYQAPYDWNSNPYVFVYEFEMVR